MGAKTAIGVVNASKGIATGVGIKASQVAVVGATGVIATIPIWGIALGGAVIGGLAIYGGIELTKKIKNRKKYKLK